MSDERDLIESIQEHRGQDHTSSCYRRLGGSCSCGHDISTDVILGAAETEIASLRTKLESARKALEPFAAIAVDVEKDHPGWAHYAFHSDWTEYQLGFEHFDRARLALTDETGK